jgi:L-seryl-tRNA(Ser) seleniumtransferase
MARVAARDRHPQSALFRRLPSVDEVVRRAGMGELIERAGRAAVAEAARTVLEEWRAGIGSGALDAGAVEAALAGLRGAVEAALRVQLSYSLRPVINATGVILHTNLGRAPLAAAALDHLRATAGVYCNLEFDAGAGARGRRDVHTGRLFTRLLGRLAPGSAGSARGPAAAAGRAEWAARSDVATVVVNNNAAAVLLALNSLAEGGEVIVSRGELVEIGGSFRIPEVMAKSGASLREVGTTNRTRPADFERAINERTRLLLRVHRSNFAIFGFTEQPAREELVELGGRHGIPVMEDLGSGALLPLESVGVKGEPDIAASLRAGMDVVTYSGDKLLGGPQCGMLSGRAELIARIRQNPLFRALRVDKLTCAALEATLLAYVRQDYDAIPALRFMRLPVELIAARAAAIAAKIRSEEAGTDGETGRPGSRRLSCEVIDGVSLLGGGSAPGATLPTKLLALAGDGIPPDALAARLRQNDPPIIARVEEGRVLLDLRTVFEEQDREIESALRALL